MIHPFSCPRTCRLFLPDRCRFQPIFAELGHRQTVTSHTAKINVQYKNREALIRAAHQLNARILGEGNHKLYQGTYQGFGIHFPEWRYPIVVQPDAIFCDTFNGNWGNPRDLQALSKRYTIECAKLAAEAQGWYCEEQNDTVIIYHPDGGTMTVTPDGTVDASGFCGQDCHAAAPIEEALGKIIETAFKPEYFLRRTQIAEAES